MTQRNLLPPYGLSDEEATAIYQAKRKRAFVSSLIFLLAWLGFSYATLFVDVPRTSQWTEMIAFALMIVFVGYFYFSLRCPNCTVMPLRAVWLLGYQATNAESCHNCGVKLGGTQKPAARKPGRL
jgi:hypothetical protein